MGRVVRFDSFSKILSAGLRLGFVTGPKEVLDAIDLDTSSRNLQTSGTSQAIAYALLKTWGVEGFLKHADNVAKFYQVRFALIVCIHCLIPVRLTDFSFVLNSNLYESSRYAKQDRLERFESSAKRILTASPSVATWVRPTAGMFLWIKLTLPPPPPEDKKATHSI